MTDNRKRKVQTRIYKTLQKKTQNRGEIKRSRMISSSCSTYIIHYITVERHGHHPIIVLGTSIRK
jgi:hypothetical protein